MNRRNYYPPNWEQLAYEAKERARWMCEVCLVPHGAIVRSPRTGNPYVIYLQAAHLDHDHDNPRPRLISVCARCHQRYYRRNRVYTSSVPLLCKRRRALQRKWDALNKKASPSSLAAGASNETAIISKSQLTNAPFYSSRVQFGWQLEEGEQP